MCLFENLPFFPLSFRHLSTHSSPWLPSIFFSTVPPSPPRSESNTLQERKGREERHEKQETDSLIPRLYLIFRRRSHREDLCPLGRATPLPSLPYLTPLSFRERVNSGGEDVVGEWENAGRRGKGKTREWNHDAIIFVPARERVSNGESPCGHWETKEGRERGFMWEMIASSMNRKDEKGRKGLASSSVGKKKNVTKTRGRGAAFFTERKALLRNWSFRQPPFARKKKDNGRGPGRRRLDDTNGIFIISLPASIASVTPHRASGDCNVKCGLSGSLEPSDTDWQALF